MAKNLPLHTPFAKLGQQMAKVKSSLPLAAEAPPPPLPTALACAPSAAEEEAIFLRAMQGVKNMEPGPGRVIPPARPLPGSAVPINPDLEVMVHLAELVAGDQDIHLSWHKDFVRAAGSRINHRILELLEAGRFPIQDYLDLHGLGTEEAMLALEKFFKQSRERGLRHVLLVHGKGKGSAGGESVLKETLGQRLCHKRFARWVLAFCSAQAKDGGTGAMYVLLKTWQGPTIFRPRRAENSA